MYSYEALDRKEKQIRVITLLPGSRGSRIQCTIKIVELGVKPDYEALSYEWGPPGYEGEIMLDNESFLVRSNLLLALSHLRSSKVSKTFWIDAIYIDQTNIPERNSQVEMMGDIYRKASIVRAWLGPESDDSADAFQLLRRFKKSHSGAPNSKRAHRLSDNEKEVLHSFTNLTYWTRVWIVQELVLAREIVFHCGDEDLVWWPTLLTSLRLAGFFHSPAGLILSLRDWRRKNTLLALMRNCYAAQATDARDKVYALLGIADDVTPEMIPVNYKIAVDDLKSQVDKLYRHQERLTAPFLWQALGSSNMTLEDTSDPELGFSRYLDSYFRRPEIFRQIEETRILAVSTSYNTSAVKDKLRSLLLELENIEKFDARRVDSGIGMDDDDRCTTK